MLKKKGATKDGVKPTGIQVETQGAITPILRTRTSPRVLFDYVKHLKLDQRAVEGMGLGKLLDMKIDGMPCRLGYYIVDKLDTNEINSELEMVLSTLH